MYWLYWCMISHHILSYPIQHAIDFLHPSSPMFSNRSAIQPSAAAACAADGHASSTVLNSDEIMGVEFELNKGVVRNG